jgi:predicted unusual protein kinase regulating ubiquinone biosynthesis (AarF/ABC1/UbiB family)
MQKVIEHELGERIPDLFCEFDRDAAAAASIGQVYQARLHDGRKVAVKSNTPGSPPRFARTCRTWGC